MFTKKTVCEEICEFLNGPITPDRINLLANLLYIKEHCHELSDDMKSDDVKLGEWVKHMENADGTTGPHWGWNDAVAIRKKYGIPCDNLEFYVTLNMMYSDYCAAIDKAGAATVELYARMAEAFLADPDAQPDKLGRYYRYIARHDE